MPNSGYSEFTATRKVNVFMTSTGEITNIIPVYGAKNDVSCKELKHKKLEKMKENKDRHFLNNWKTNICADF